MASVGAINIGMRINTNRFRKDLNTTQSMLGKFQSYMTPANLGLAAMAAGAAAAGAALMSMQRIMQEMSDIDPLAKAALAMDVPLEKLIALRHLFETSGVGAANAEKVMTKFSQSLVAIRQGSAASVDALDLLGLSISDISGLRADQALGVIADRFKDLKSQTDRSQVAFKLFGKSGLAMINVLDQGSEGLKRSEERTKAFGVSLTDIDAQALQRANDAWYEMGELSRGVWTQFTIQLSPIIASIGEQMVELGITYIDWGKIAHSTIINVTKVIAHTADTIDGMWKITRISLGLTAKTFAYLLYPIGWVHRAITDLIKLIPGVGQGLIDTLNFLDVQKQLDGIADSAMSLDGIFDRPSDSIMGFVRDLDKGSGKVRSFAKGMGADLEEAFSDGMIASIKLKESLEDQIEVYRYGADAAERSKLYQDGATESTLKQIDALKNLKKAFEIKRSGQDMIASLEGQIRTLKLGADNAQIYEMRLKGVSEAIIQQVKALQAQRKAIEQSKSAQADLMSAAERLTEQFSSPFEKLTEEFREVQDLFSRGLINPETFQRAMRDIAHRAKESLQIEVTPKLRLAPNAELGSEAARQSIMRHREGHTRNKNPMQKMEQYTEKQLSHIEKMPQLLTNIAKAIKPGALTTI